MIFVDIVRRCVCAVCGGDWIIGPGAEPDERCLHCGSYDWMWGPDNEESRLIRLGINRLRKSLNPGTKKTLKQLKHTRSQWRSFRKKNPMDGITTGKLK